MYWLVLYPEPFNLNNSQWNLLQAARWHARTIWNLHGIKGHITRGPA